MPIVFVRLAPVGVLSKTQQGEEREEGKRAEIKV